MTGLPDIDSELIARAKKKDEEAIADIIHQIDKRCYSIVFHCLNGNKRHVEEIEDIVQDAYIKAFTSLDKLKDDNNFAPWMYTILERALIDYTRSSLAKN